MKYSLILRNRTMLLCFGLGICFPAFSSIIIDNIIETEEVCDLSNGTITILAQGGLAVLSYSVDGGMTFQSSNYFDGLESNDYLIIVSDGTNCTEIEAAQITSSTTPKIDVAADCITGSDLINIDLIPFNSGIPPFTYEWSGPDGIYDTEDLTQVPTGTYTVTVHDRDGCQVDSTFHIPICCSLQLESTSETTTYNCIADFVEVSNLTFDTLDNSARILALQSLLHVELNGEPCNTISLDITTEEIVVDCSEPRKFSSIITIDDGVNTQTISKTYLIERPQDLKVLCPTDLTIESEEINETTALTWLQSARGSDNCSELTVTHDFDYEAIDLMCAASHEVEFLVADDCGNQATCLSQVTIGIIKPIEITCPEFIDIGCSEIKPDSLIFQVLDSMTIVSPYAYEVEYDYSLDIYEIGCDFVYTFDADVRIYDSCDQEAECRIRVDVEPQPIVFIPNTFSPGVRNIQNLTVYANPVIEKVETFQVYNRWGKIVHEAYNFQANDESMGWNGTINNESNDMEVYTYHVVCKSITGKELKYAGSITLLK